MRVLGADVCQGRWVGIVLTDHGFSSAHFEDEIATLVERATVPGPLDAIALDIPIGLPSAAARRSDREAALFIGPRRSSVFTTPVRAALETDDFAEAVLLNRAATGVGISKQAHGLRHKIREVAAWRATVTIPVVEAHPEVCFRAMAGEPLAEPKKTWAGARRRHALLTEQGIVLGEMGEAGKAAVDDVLDAAAAAWTAHRVARGAALWLPAEVTAPDPRRDVELIWY